MPTILPDSSGQGRGYICWMPRRPKDTPAKFAGRMKRRWRVVLLRAKDVPWVDGTPTAYSGTGGLLLGTHGG